MTVPWEVMVLPLNSKTAVTGPHPGVAGGRAALLFYFAEALEALRKESVASSFATRLCLTAPIGLADCRRGSRQGSGGRNLAPGGLDEYLEAMRLGAFDVIAVPCRRPTSSGWSFRPNVMNAPILGRRPRRSPAPPDGDGNRFLTRPRCAIAEVRCFASGGGRYLNFASALGTKLYCTRAVFSENGFTNSSGFEEGDSETKNCGRLDDENTSHPAG